MILFPRIKGKCQKCGCPIYAGGLHLHGEGIDDFCNRANASQQKGDEMKLSVLVPGIRTANWRKLYDSIAKSCKYEFEFIIISPYELLENMHRLENVVWIQDWGTPIRCQQRGLCAAKGQYITWAADDGEYFPRALDIAMDKLKEVGFDPMTLVMGKYFEGSNPYDNEVMAGTQYYVLSRHDASRSKHIPADYLMLNVGVVPRKLLIDLGGWDCQFEVCPMAYNDLAIRLQRYGVKFIIQNELMFSCTHMPGHEGDHGPIHDAQVYHDQPLFRKIYSVQASTGRDKIPLDNWKLVPERWARRFGR